MIREHQMRNREQAAAAGRACSSEHVLGCKRRVVGRAGLGRWAAVLGAVLVSLAAGAMAQDSVLPSFPLQQGWLGGDIAYSIPLDNSNRVLWLFGDSYVRNDSELDRYWADVVPNTIAIRTSDGVTQNIDYYWQDQDTQNPHAFFRSGTDAWTYWPEDGFMYNGKLYVCLVRIERNSDAPSDFQRIGVDLASISNPQDPPLDWQITYTRLTYSDHIFPGISTVVDGDYVYLFAVRDDQDHQHNRPVYLARIPLEALDVSPRANLQFLAANNVWKPGPIDEDVIWKLMDYGATEMTVRWHPNINRWVAVSMNNEDPPHQIWRRQAPSLTGPWSAPTCIYSVPDYSRHHDNENLFYYGAKEHSEFLNASNGTSVVTYVGNSSSFWDLAHDLSLYVPEVVTLNVDPNPSGTFRGLFVGTNTIAAQSCGTLTLTSTRKGAFTGTLRMGNARYPLRGTFDDTGAATATVLRRNLAPLTVMLQINRSAGQDHMDGTVSDGTWTAPLGVDRALYDGHMSIAPQSGHYTMLLAGSHDASGLPAGDGYATLWVDRAGTVHFTGRLADGTAVYQAARLAGTGLWPLYIPLYRGQGCLAGWVAMPTDTNAFSGSLNWIKPADPHSKNYAEGLALAVAFSGSSYNHPSSAAPVLDLTQGQVTLTGGGLSQSLTNSILLGYGNRVKDLGANRLRLSFSAASGAFTGRVTDPATGRPVVFQGVVLQDQEIGSGYFLGAGQSGWVSLSAP